MQTQTPNQTSLTPALQKTQLVQQAASGRLPNIIEYSPSPALLKEAVNILWYAEVPGDSKVFCLSNFQR